MGSPKDRASSKDSPPSAGYLHGYSPEEQERLYKQARFLERIVYEHVDFSKQQSLLEVGSGVGAQTEILLERFPHIKIQCIDISPVQVEQARKRLQAVAAKGQVKFDVGNATQLPYPTSTFDGAYLCWFLEHVQEPIAILKEIHRVLKPEGVIFCSEVMNATFFLHPYSPATLQYWFAFNDHQWTLRGDPFVGGKLANYLLTAGFGNVSTEVKTMLLDNRAPKQRAETIEYWTNLLLSGAPSLLEAGKVTQELVDEMTRELERLKGSTDAVFFYSFVQARAQAF